MAASSSFRAAPMEEHVRAEFQRTTLLVSEAQAGNRSALEDLFRRYLPVVRNIVAMRMGLRLRQLVDSDDLVQEALLRVFQSIGRFDHKAEGSFRHWLARCVERQVIDSAKRLKAQKRGGGRVRPFSDYESEMTLVSIPASGDPRPSEIIYGQELEERLEVALLKMNERQREWIILRQLCGMSYAEIAEVTGVKEPTVRRTVARALKKLERLMAGE
jgi:RNA polymerase sigma-70 factor (ECF subfamily)